MGRFNRRRKGASTQGRAPDLGNTFFHSRMERNYARYLKFLEAGGQIARWEYETETFWFHKIKRGVRSYKPDFKVWVNNSDFFFVETKGWLDQKSKTALKRMRIYYPEIHVRLVQREEMREIARYFAERIPHWEPESY